jgi:hypothetical protein
VSILKSVLCWFEMEDQIIYFNINNQQYPNYVFHTWRWSTSIEISRK